MQENKDIIEYIHEDISSKIVFYQNFKEVAKLYTFEISMQELKAINTKVKELGWEE